MITRNETLASYVLIIIGAVFALVANLKWFNSPGLTAMQALIEYWPWWLASGAALLCSILVTIRR